MPLEIGLPCVADVAVVVVAEHAGVAVVVAEHAVELASPFELTAKFAVEPAVEAVVAVVGKREVVVGKCVAVVEIRVVAGLC